MGYGAALTAAAFLMLLCHGLAARGWCRGDAFVVGAIGIVVALIVIFVFFPVVDDPDQRRSGRCRRASRLASSSRSSSTARSGGSTASRANLRCGVAWNTLFLAVLVGVGTTLLGLAFALVATRTGFRFKALLRVLTVLPIITPPFVIGLALILLFGRSGARHRAARTTGSASRARAGSTACRACCIAQLLAFTPIAFLVLIGVVQGISPSLEEAAQTLRASRWTTFRTVTWPLMRPGPRQRVPARLRREHGRLRQSAGARRQFRRAVDQDLLRRGRRRARSGPRRRAGDRAARLHARRVLAAAALARPARLHDRHRQGRRRHSRCRCRAGVALALLRRSRCRGRCFTVVVYAIILVGGFVRDDGPRLHADARALSHRASRSRWTTRGLFFSGSAWNSFFTTIEVAAIAAPLTAAHRPADRLAADAPAFRRPARLRVRAPC